MKKIVFFISAIIFSNLLVAQDCKVLLDNIKGTYEGDCKKGVANGKGTATGADTYIGEFKKGLPHGFGKYTWENGDVYEGEWTKGQMDGKGKMAYASPDVTNKIVSGYWSKGDYIGEYSKPYKVWDKSPYVTSVRADKSGPENEIKVAVNVKGKAARNAVIQVEPTKGFFGRVIPEANFVRIDKVQYPFRAVLTYEGEKIDIEIQQPGSWLITLDINK